MASIISFPPLEMHEFGFDTIWCEQRQHWWISFEKIYYSTDECDYGVKYAVDLAGLTHGWTQGFNRIPIEVVLGLEESVRQLTLADFQSEIMSELSQPIRLAPFPSRTAYHHPEFRAEFTVHPNDCGVLTVSWVLYGKNGEPVVCIPRCYAAEFLSDLVFCRRTYEAFVSP